MKNKTLLISGITGFIGTNLKNYLADNSKIIGVSRSSIPQQNIISYQELSKNHFNQALAFIHLAGKAHDLENITSEIEYYQVNTNLTISLFNRFLKSSCKIFIFLSTVKAVADKVEGILDETVLPTPKTVYGKSKLKAENYIRSKSLPPSKKVYILRPCMVHGPNNKGNFNLLIKIVNNKIPFPFGKFNNERSFLCIDNLCFVIEKLLLKQPESGTFNVSDDGTLSTNQLVRLIGQVLNKQSIIINVPKPMIKSIANLGQLFPLLLNKERLEKLTENYRVSNLKIKEAVKEPLPLSINEGFIKTIKSFKN